MRRQQLNHKQNKPSRMRREQPNHKQKEIIPLEAGATKQKNKLKIKSF